MIPEKQEAVLIVCNLEALRTTVDNGHAQTRAPLPFFPQVALSVFSPLFSHQPLLGILSFPFLHPIFYLGLFESQSCLGPVHPRSANHLDVPPLSISYGLNRSDESPRNGAHLGEELLAHHLRADEEAGETHPTRIFRESCGGRAATATVRPSRFDEFWSRSRRKAR